MPTKHSRTHITHTARVARALAVARTRWPDEQSESTLILNLLDEGAKAIEEDERSEAAARTSRVRELAGKYSALYGPGYLEDVRAGWGE